MRELTLTEISNVTGARSSDVLTGIVLGLGAAALVSATPSYSYSYYPSTSYHYSPFPPVSYVPVTDVYDVSTPVFDYRGRYLGNRVDTYVTESYEPIIW